VKRSVDELAIHRIFRSGVDATEKLLNPFFEKLALRRKRVNVVPFPVSAKDATTAPLSVSRRQLEWETKRAETEFSTLPTLRICR
jgi:hypothetical protein